jgi:hypothetical protein
MRRDILEYLWRRFPHHCIVLTDPGMLRVIDLGMERAAAHGFYEPEQACSWIVLMIFFGSYFDEDPLHEWVGPALDDGHGMKSGDAVAVLFDRMNAAVNPILGKDAIHYREALGQVGKLKFETILGEEDQSLSPWLQIVFPAKLAAMSAGSREYLFARSREWSSRYGLAEGSGAVECLLLMALFGSHIDRDPLRPWAAAALQNPSPVDSVQKTIAVHDALQRTLRRFAVLDRFRDGVTAA